MPSPSCFSIPIPTTSSTLAGEVFAGPEISRTSLCTGRGAGRLGRHRAPPDPRKPRGRRLGTARADLFESEGFVAYYSVPLLAKGQVKGVLEVFHRSPLDPDAEWLDYLNTLGRTGGHRDRQRLHVRSASAIQRRTGPGLRCHDRGLVSRPGSARQGDRGTQPSRQRDDPSPRPPHGNERG